MSDMWPQAYWHGVAVSQEDRDRMAKQVFEHLAKSEKDNDESFIMGGDALVVGYKRPDYKGGSVIEISDCIVRRHTAYTPDGEHAWDHSD